MPTPEKVIESAILDWLNLIDGCFAIKINNVGVWDQKKKIYRKNQNKHIHNGVSDILFCYRGRFGAIEVKAGYNKPTKDQTQFLKKIIANGGVSFWTNGIDDCIYKFAEKFPDYRFKNKPLFEDI